MIKKISILTLLLLFFVSTTGLPLTIHFCNMMKNEVRTTCKMHNPENKIVEQHSACCKEKENDHSTSIKKQDCCKLETVIAGVKDSFISSKTEIQNILETKVVLVSGILSTLISQAISNYSFIDISPPILQSNNLYLTNSILLI